MLDPLRFGRSFSQRARWLALFLVGSLVLLGTAPAAQAQSEDTSYPTVDISANLMQSAQFLEVDDTNPLVRPELEGSHDGFHQVRAGLTVNAQFSERVSGLLNVEAEPNDFGQNGFGPAIDLVFIDLAVTDGLTLRAGTPVTGLLNFRGFSDGPAVQGNPLVGNSPADMITAAQGVQLVGSYDAFGFDFTINRSFAETFSSEQTGLNYIGKVRYTGSEVVKVGGGFAVHSGAGVTPNGDEAGDPAGVVFANGDRENYNFPGTGTNSTETHANMPAGSIFMADGKLTPGNADIDAWIGYGTEDRAGPTYDTFEALFLGLGLKYSLTDRFYVAGRLTYVGDQSDAVDDLDHTAVSRTQFGLGYEVFDRALFKVEYVRQVEGANTALSRIGNNWSGITTELSVNM